MSKKILSVVIAVVMIAATLIPAFSVFADEVPGVQNPVTEDTALWDRIDDDGWYTSPDGGFKFKVGSWSYYGPYGLNIVEDPLNYPTNSANISVYAPGSSSVDSPEVFENKTKANFEAVLKQTVNVFEKRTVGNEKDTMYYAQTQAYENYVFQANGTKYFINFIYGHLDLEDPADRKAFTDFAAQVMSTIVLADDAEPSQDEPAPEIPDTGDNYMVYVAIVTAVLALAVIVLSKKSAKAR